MLLNGDEIGRSQKGNNNPYCQDNETSWLDWKNADQELLQFTRFLIALRKNNPILRRDDWLRGGENANGSETFDIVWLKPDGTVMSSEDWRIGFAKSLVILLNRSTTTASGAEAGHKSDDCLLIMFNAHYEQLIFRLPTADWGKDWIRIFDTSQAIPEQSRCANGATELVSIYARSLAVFRRWS